MIMGLKFESDCKLFVAVLGTVGVKELRVGPLPYETIEFVKEVGLPLIFSLFV